MRSGVAPCGLGQLRLNRQLLAIDQRQCAQLQSQFRSRASVLLSNEGDTARFRLAAAGDYPSVNNDRLVKRGAELVTDNISIG
jgi:hypothetical protein